MAIHIAMMLMGSVLGLLGGGGAVLTIPLLMWLEGRNLFEATTASLFLVSALSILGAAEGILKKTFQWKPLIWVFAGTSLGVGLARLVIVPWIPKTPGWEQALALTFSALLIFVGLQMALKKSAVSSPVETNAISHRLGVQHFLILLGVGILTGVLGAGGGFLLIPVLTSVFRLSMQQAVPTSLGIIALNTGLGYALSFGGGADAWSFTFPLLALTVSGAAGMGIGIWSRKRFSSAQLKRSFGVLAAMVGIVMGIKNL